MNYFRLAEVKGIFEELDGWIRRKLRCVIWRQWKRVFARATGLMKRGLERDWAFRVLHEPPYTEPYVRWWGGREPRGSLQTRLTDM